MSWRGVLFALSIALALAGWMGFGIWYDANRLDRRYCVQSHVVEDTCMSMMQTDIRQPATSMPYYYPCDRTVCDAVVCEHRATRDAPWEEEPCP